jgi:hypothetical protein
MANFLAKRPTVDANWRAVVLFGRNVASYKFALAKTLLGIADRSDDRVPLEELAAPFSRQLCEHLARVDKQTTSPSSRFWTPAAPLIVANCLRRSSFRRRPISASTM